MGSILKKGLFLVTFSGAALALPATAQASDTAADPVMPSVGIEEVLSDCYASGQEIDASDYLVPTEKGEYLDMAFANVDSFLYIRSEPTKQSAWVGKLYPDYAAKITGPVDEWTKIQSGSCGRICVFRLHYNRKQRRTKSPGDYRGGSGRGSGRKAGGSLHLRRI